MMKAYLRLMIIALSGYATWGSADNEFNCDDINTLASYGVIGEKSFDSGNGSTINGEEITGSGNTPTPSGEKQQVDVDFDPFYPTTFPSTGRIDIERSTSFTLSAGSYDDIELDDSNGSLTMTGGDYFIDKLELKKQGSTLYMAPGNYFIDELKMDSQNNLVITGDGVVNLYINDKFEAGNEAAINSVGSVGDFFVYLYSDAKIDIGNGDQGHDGADFVGIIYAPFDDTEIKFGNSNNITAAIFSEGEVDVGNNTDFTYSTAVKNQVLSTFNCPVTNEQNCSVFLDEFSSTSYSRNDGSANWSSGWQESGDNNSADSGDIEIQDRVLQLEGDGEASNNLGGPYISRSVDLTGFSTATLSFDYKEEGKWESDDKIYISISKDNANTWETIKTFNDDQGKDWQSFSISLSQYVGNQVTIAIVEAASKKDEIFYIDDFQIKACGDSQESDPVIQADSFNITETSLASENDAFKTENAKIYTKLVGESFTLSIAAIDSDGDIQSGYAEDVTGGRDLSVSLVVDDGTSCPDSIPDSSQSVNFSSYKKDVTFNLDKAYKNVRVKVIDQTEDRDICALSSDSFVIRPHNFTLSQSLSTIKAGEAFELTAQTDQGYEGSLEIFVSGYTEVASGLVLGDVTVVSAYEAFTESGDPAKAQSKASLTYSETGAVTLKPGFIIDNNYTSGDQCNPGSGTNLVNGKYGCDIVNDAYEINTFIPYAYDLVIDDTGRFYNQCNGSEISYAYITGEPDESLFDGVFYLTNPVIEIRPVNKSFNLTQNYTMTDDLSVWFSTALIDDMTKLSNGQNFTYTASLANLTSGKSKASLNQSAFSDYLYEIDMQSAIDDFYANAGSQAKHNAFDNYISFKLENIDGDVNAVDMNNPVDFTPASIQLRWPRLYFAEKTSVQTGAALNLDVEVQYLDESGNWITASDDNCSGLKFDYLDKLQSDYDPWQPLNGSGTVATSGDKYTANAGMILIPWTAQSEKGEIVFKITGYPFEMETEATNGKVTLEWIEKTFSRKNNQLFIRAR